MNTDPHSHDANARSEPAPDAANANAPLSPDQLMQAATARIAELEAELAEMKDRWIRSEAETANVRARGRREAEDARQYAVQKFATDIVEAAENLKRAIDALPAASPRRAGHPGQSPRRPRRDRAQFHRRSGTQRHPESTIRSASRSTPTCIRRWPSRTARCTRPAPSCRPGPPCWTLHGRLLKPAMVVVAKAPTAELPAPAAGSIPPPDPGS